MKLRGTPFLSSPWKQLLLFPKGDCNIIININFLIFSYESIHDFVGKNDLFLINKKRRNRFMKVGVGTPSLFYIKR